MYDYYKVRFREILPERRGISRVTFGKFEHVRLPSALRLVYFSAAVLFFLGLLVSLAASRSPLQYIPMGLGGFVLILPVTALVAIGFHSDQRWTRPLLVVLVGCAALIAGLAGFLVVCAIVSMLTLLTAWYLYRWPATRLYYRQLAMAAPVRFEIADLRSATFLPIYTATVGLVAGGFFGTLLFDAGARHGLEGFNDQAGLVCLVILWACVLGAIGRRVGEAILARSVGES